MRLAVQGVDSRGWCREAPLRGFWMARDKRKPDRVRLWLCFFFSSRRRHTRFDCDWSSDVCSSDLFGPVGSKLGWTPGANDSEEQRARRADLWVLVAEAGRDPKLVPLARDLMQKALRDRKSVV